jgi:hypothetical protein
MKESRLCDSTNPGCIAVVAAVAAAAAAAAAAAGAAAAVVVFVLAQADLFIAADSRFSTLTAMLTPAPQILPTLLTRQNRSLYAQMCRGIVPCGPKVVPDDALSQSVLEAIMLD